MWARTSTSPATKVPAENSLAVTELNMISVHCTAAAAEAAPAAAVSARAETVSTPPDAAAVAALTPCRGCSGWRAFRKPSPATDVDSPVAGNDI